MTKDITISPGQNTNTLRRQVFQYTGPTLYVAGGDPLTPSDFRMGAIHAVLGGFIGSGTALRLVFFDEANGKLQIFVPDTGAEAAGDLSTFSGRLEVVGR